MTKPTGRPPGRPKKSQRYTKLMISLPPEQAAWLRQQSEGISPMLQRLISAEQAKTPHLDGENSEPVSFDK